jgi:hypothetical protein
MLDLCTSSQQACQRSQKSVRLKLIFMHDFELNVHQNIFTAAHVTEIKYFMVRMCGTCSLCCIASIIGYFC